MNRMVAMTDSRFYEDGNDDDEYYGIWGMGESEGREGKRMINVKTILSNSTDKSIDVSFIMTFTIGDAQRYIADVKRVHTQECLQTLFTTSEKLETELKKLGLLQEG